MSERIAVAKTYKLYLGGGFPRSESGRSYPVSASNGDFLANAALGSRKDARDGVVQARQASAGWAETSAYNRGQVLYRVAEMMEGRREQFIVDVTNAEGAQGSGRRTWWKPRLTVGCTTPVGPTRSPVC